MITQAELKSLLHYDPDTGIFTWLISPCSNVQVGSKTGSLRKDGYIQVGINKVLYLSHRLAWLYETGENPPNQVDHINNINNIKNDNRFKNLRLATNAENMRNRDKTINNVSGFKGVYWHKQNEKWVAHCMINGEPQYLGLFNTKELASDAYESFTKLHYGDFYNSGDQNEQRQKKVSDK